MFGINRLLVRSLIATLVLVLAFATVAGHNLALAQSGNVVLVNTGALNIRSGPAPNTTVIGTVPGGTELPVTGRNLDATWWRVQSPFGVGWVADAYVAFRGTLSAVPVVSTPAGTPETPTIVVDGMPATLHRNPNPASFVLGIVPSGASLMVIGRSPDGTWFQVQSPVGPGWVSGEDVVLRGDYALIPAVADPGPTFAGPTVRFNAGTTISAQPGGGSVVGSLAPGTALPAIGRTADNTWWQISGPFGTGWAAVNNVSLAGSASNIPVTANVYLPGPGYTGAPLMSAVVESERKVAYALDSYDSDPMWDALLGEQLGVTARNPSGLWLEVFKSNGWHGWMHFSGLTLQGNMAALPVINTAPVITNTAIVNTRRLNVRSGPAAEYASLTSVPGGTALLVTGHHPTLPWLRVAGDFGVGWVHIDFIIFRGDWNAVPSVTEPIGALETPQAIVSTPHYVYSSPGWESRAGTIQPGLYPIVGWSQFYTWAQIQTDLGLVWINSAEFEVRGTAINAPVLR